MCQAPVHRYASPGIGLRANHPASAAAPMRAWICASVSRDRRHTASSRLCMVALQAELDYRAQVFQESRIAPAPVVLASGRRPSFGLDRVGDHS